MEKLIVKNFGAIQNIEISLNNLVVFIGKTGTGKSTLAKLLSIFRSADFWMNAADRDIFLENLSYYQINNFLGDSTVIEYQSKVGTFVYDAGKIDREFSKDILRNLAKFAQTNKVVEQDGNLAKFAQNKDITSQTSKVAEQDKNTISIVEEIVNFICHEVVYIPAERTVVSFLSEKYPALDRERLIDLFPGPLLDFTAKFNLASSIVGKLAIDLFDVTYQKKGGKDYISLSNGKQFLLSESASGQQTTIPALVVFDCYAQDDRKKSYTFEEPELNLFPIAQKSLVELLAEKVLSNGHKVIITTHSPYILTSINNLLFASKIQEEYPESKTELTEVSGLKSFISSSDIAVYDLSIEQDTDYCTNLIDEDTGMIPDNELDSASEEIIEVFDRLMGVYRELKRSNHR